MSALTETMEYEELKATLRSFGAVDTELFRIFGILNSAGRCHIQATEGVYVTIEHGRVGYRVTIDS